MGTIARGVLLGACVSLVDGGMAGAATPPLVNPGFDADGTGVAAPAGWTSVGSDAADFSETGGYSGGFQLSHWSAEAFAVDTRQAVRGLRDGWYTLRARVRRSGGQNESYVALDCGRGSEQRVHLPVAPADQWLQVVVSARSTRGRCSVVLHTTAAAGEWSNFDEVELVPGAARLSLLGADVSSLAKSEDLGGEYLECRCDDECRPGSALGILADAGVDTVRLRAWVDPADGYHGRDELLRMARRAKRHGLGVLVDLHYSDVWADPGRQDKPAAWASCTPAELTQAVYDHTFDVCRRMLEQGTPPDIVQLGNELNSGMLWPDGHTWDPPNWDNLGDFLSAGASAIQACSPSTRIMLHLANGGDNGLYQWWFDNITQRGVPFDIIGASFYPYWHGSLGDLQRNLNDVSARYGKDVVVVETAYPFTLDGVDATPNLIGLPEQLVPGYAATPDGQAAFLRDLLAIVRAVPGGHGLGAFYWDATWTAVPGNGWDPTDPASGNSWENQALFDFGGKPLPALRAFRR
ncbi:MAG TPA: arabinogalactan endo-1,4-beta-galactosidase [Polyangiaceae bacterium]|nr:arabinogalactan endo-1,4-beta-galactosidase [Polyangiaceae bacterium]